MPSFHLTLPVFTNNFVWPASKPDWLFIPGKATQTIKHRLMEFASSHFKVSEEYVAFKSGIVNIHNTLIPNDFHTQPFDTLPTADPETTFCHAADK